MPLSSNPYKVQAARRYARHFTGEARRYALAYFAWLNGDSPHRPWSPRDLPATMARRIRLVLWGKLTARNIGRKVA